MSSSRSQEKVPRDSFNKSRGSALALPGLVSCDSGAVAALVTESPPTCRCGFHIRVRFLGLLDATRLFPYGCSFPH